MSQPGATDALQTALIVDDDPEARSILTAHVESLGLASDEAENGVSALAHARRSLPDVILLDIEMPIMNGRETLAWFKADPALRDVPIIVISGGQETAVAVRCIEAGAEDFLTKPVDLTLLRARIRSSLDRARLRAMEKAYQRQMEAYGAELEARVREKTAELTDAHERLGILDRAKDEFLQLICHELRTPMTGVVFASDAITEGLVSEPHDESRRETAQLLRDSAGRLARIIEDALLLTSIKVSADVFSMEPRSLPPIVAAAAKRASAAAKDHGLEISQKVDERARILCDERLLTDALTALFECARKFSSPGQVVRVDSTPRDDAVRLTIRTRGSSIPAAKIPRFFEILSLGADPLTPGGDLGLGPPVAAQLLRLVGGAVEVEPTEGGVSFVVTLRSVPPEAAQLSGTS